MTLIVLTIAAVLLAAAFAFLFYRLASRLDREIVVTDWLSRFSLEGYAPMARLLDPTDFAFFESQPGCYPALARRLRAERREAFLGYLGLLIRDFNQLLRIGRIIQIGSSVDRPEFARALWRQQINFYVGVCLVWCKVALLPWGVPVDGRNLVAALTRMFGEVRELAVLRNEA
jgi:hypothetical protein